MEAAYDKNNSNSAFDNDSSHFKFSNTDGGFNISPDLPVSNDSEECQISAPNLVKNCYNEPNDVHITDESVDVVDNHQRFEDDFGPETDVDAMDETTFIKSPVEPQATDNNNEFSLSNGIKPFSLENKIMQQLSEQNRDFLTDSNPFKNDHFDQYSDDHAILDQTTKASDESSAEVVDNKIIDALESLAVSNGENEKHELEDGKQEGDLLDIRQQSPDIPDLTEKADYVHEKNLFILDSAAKPDDTFMQHSDSTFNLAEDQKSSLIEQGDTPSLADTRCVDESVGEDSEEEEDEWNYIKGDKKSEEKHNPNAAELVADSAQSPEIQSSESVVEVVNTTVSNLALELPLLDFTSGQTVQKEEEEEALDENEKIDETKDDIVETAESISKTEEPVQEVLGEQLEDTAVSIEQELADYENNVSIIASSEVALSCENYDPVPFDEKLNLDTAPNLLLEETSPSELVVECSSSSEIAAEKEQPSTEVVVEDKPFTDIVTEEAPSTETVTEPTSSMNIVPEETPSADIVVEEVPVEKQTTEEQLSDIAKETSVDEELERPDSLSFEMASKLNPEAKEFVPVSSPTSPVANAPSMIPNSFLMLDDDTVVAQSPKKFTTMDNIDVPAEDDFQHEMNNRPHEIEKPSEYLNGNADVSARSHSPVSEPSYQELNLKEAMQADEKLEHDYNDEKQVVTEDSPSDIPNEQNILNVLNKEQDPMNMSFYEGRDEALLSNSDELNKVHMLPEVDDEIEEQSIDDTDKVQVDMHDLTPTDSKHVQLLEDKMEITELESTSQPSCEEELQSNPAPGEPSAAIFAVASQVVNDVAALVDQMQIESPIVNDADLDHSEELHLEIPVEMPTEITTDAKKLEENRDILISLELQTEIKPLEEAIDIGLHTESPSPNPVENLHAAETEELISPLVESIQQEVAAENEFITDESVLNVQSPSQSMFSAESPTEPEPVLEEPIKDPITTETTENFVVEPVAELIETVTTPNLLETVTPVLEQVAAVPDANKVVEELKPVVAGLKSTTTKPADKSSTTTKPAASKTTTAKTAKPAAPTVEKKTTTTAKLSAKPATTKPSTTTKPPTTSLIKKTSTVSSATSTKTPGAAKPASSSSIGRTAGSTTNKLSTEKKAPLTVRKPTMTAVNGEAKAAPAARKPTTTLKSTTIAKSSSTSSGSATSARPSSASVRSTTVKPSTATTKSTTSATARLSTTTTARTSSTVPTAKPRTVPSTTSKTASSTTATTTTATSKSSSNAITKRFSTVGTAAPKTTTATATATTKTTTAVKTTNPVANRTSTVSKLSSTTITGVRKTTTTSPTKKPVSSPVTKTTPSSVKAPASMKIVGSNHANGKVSTEVATTTDLLDLDKQFKNDNNQLITKNGIESQMMVIDSAGD